MMLESEREQITQYIYGCLDQKLPHYQIEGHVVTGKGKPVYFLARAEIIYDESGNPIRMEGISQDITDLKKAEEELRFKEYLLQNVNDAIISTDMHMKITSWNKAAGQLYGYKAEEALGKTLHELLKFDFPPPESSYQQQFSHTGSYRGQLTMQQKEGTRVIVEAHTILLKDKKGNSIGRVSVDRDITHISQMQHKVYESQSMLQLVINTVPQAVFWKDLSHVYTGCNENFVHMFQLTGVEEILGKKDNQMYWADTHAKELQLQDEQILAGILPRLFYTKSFKTRNGSNIWLEVRLVPLYSQEGQIIGVLGTVEDITEEVDTEQALIQSKANMEAIIENTDDLIWAIDKDFKIIAMNSNLARFWSQFFDAPLQVGDSCYDMQPLWVQKRWVQIQKIVLSGQKKMLSRRFKLKDTFRWFDIACFPIIEANGQINGASYVARDVTERKTQEKLILKYLKQHSQLKLVQEKQKMMAVVKGQEEERRLISMELHDGVGQMLTALHFKMNKLTGKMLPVASADITIPLEEIVKLQKNIYQEVRRISENLMPQFLNDFPLEQALDQLTLQSFHNTGIEVEATYALHKRTFEKSIEIAIFRMAQEIFTNILKHSQATKVTVAMQLRKSAIFLLVKDNGVGFDMSVKTHKMGKGLNNISHRVSLLSGTFVVATHPGEGFQIQIKIPVSAYEKN
jgi:PAS domain S-box-containing protein